MTWAIDCVDHVYQHRAATSRPASSLELVPTASEVDQVTRPDLLGPYELLHRIAEQRGAKVLLLATEYRDERTSKLTHLMVFDRSDGDAALATARLHRLTLDEAALSCLRQMKERV